MRDLELWPPERYSDIGQQWVGDRMYSIEMLVPGATVLQHLSTLVSKAILRHQKCVHLPC